MDNFRLKHFELRHMVIAFISQKVFGSYTYTIRHGLARGMKRKGGLGFLPFKNAETAETRYLEQMPLSGKVVYDIGGFEGVLALFFASRARQVICWEPNPRNFARATENVRLNNLQNVQIINRGVSNAAGSIELTYDPLMPGAGSADAAIKGQIETSVKSARKVSIPVAPLDDQIAQNNLPTPDLIKIDIEGLEFQALQGMTRVLAERKPELYIEMHGATAKEKVENAQHVIGFLEQRGYQIFDVERAEFLTLANLGDQRPGHIHCTIPAA